MTVREGLMQTGTFSVELTDDAPLELRRLAGQLGSLISVTPTRLADTDATVASVLAAACYSGVMTKTSNKLRSLSGFGLMWYLQSGKGYAGVAYATSIPALPTTFSDVLTAWLSTSGSKSNQIGKGTAYSASTTAINDITVVPSAEMPPIRPKLDEYAAATGNEYRITPAGLMDYGVSTALFRSTPNVLICEGLSGREYGMRVLDVERLQITTDIDNFRNSAYYETSSGSYKAFGPTTDPDAVTPLRMGGSAGGVSLRRPYQKLDTTSSTDVDNTITAAANLYCTPNYDINCSVREYCAPTFLIPGDWVYVYSPDDDFHDTTYQVIVQGQTLNPKKVRVTGYTWPIEAPMGVYALYNDVVTDLSDYVKWETGRSTSLEFDLRPKSLRAAADESLIG